MLKTTLTYLAGVITTAIAVYAAGGRATIAAAVLGAFILVLVAAALLSSTKRIRAAGRLLLAFANAIDNFRTPKRPRLIKGRPAKTPQPIHQPSQAEDDLSSALKNFGMPAKSAAQTAREIVEANPQASFNDLFRLALAGRKAAA